MTPNYTKPLPTPSPETDIYWRACKDHKLVIPFCLECQASFFYPRGFCPTCLSRDIEWRTSEGRGSVYTFAIHYRAFHAGWKDDLPYVTALVDLDEGVRIFTRLVDVAPDPKAIQCGTRVEVVFDDVTDEITLPKFRPDSKVES